MNSEIGYIAHRGGAKEHPENTLQAYKEASHHPNIDGVELDVRQSDDGELICYHDGRLNLREGFHKTRNLEYEEILSNSTEEIPTLDQAYEVLDDDMTVFLDIKEDDIYDQALDQALKYENDIVLTYSDNNISTRVEDHPQVRTAKLVKERLMNRPFRHIPSNLHSDLYFSEDPEQKINEASEQGFDRVHIRKELAENTNIVDMANNKGLEVGIWTAESLEDLDTIEQWDVDSITTDVYPV